MSSTVSFPRLRSEIAGVPVAELARQFGTPTYVYDAEVIRQRVAELRPFDVIRYAQKACNNIAILDLIRREGALVDAVSAGEIARALAAGYSLEGDPPPVVYTADLFDAESLQVVVDRNVPVNCGSADMIEQLAEVAPGREITLRLNPGFGHGHSQKTNTGGPHSKHGIWHEELPRCLERADWVGLRVTGLHMHIGSGTDLEHLSQVCQAMLSSARQVGRSLMSISAGGGLPVPYQEGQQRVDPSAYFQLWDTTRKTLEQEFGHPVRLEIEPGRYLVAESGYLISEIRAVKKVGQQLFYLVDAGFNNLARPVMYGAYHPLSICPANSSAGPGSQRPGQQDELSSQSPPLLSVVVGGPLCESGDIFTQEEGGFVAPRQLPPATVGDYLIVECAGAYGFAMSSNYNGKTFAAEVLLADQQPHLIRQRQKVGDLFRDETIPVRNGDSRNNLSSGHTQSV